MPSRAWCVGRLTLITASFVLAPVSLEAQAGTPGAGFSQQSGERARVVVQKAIDAMGGVEALRGISSITRKLSGPRTDVGQGGTPVAFTQDYSRVGTIPPEVNRSTTTSFRDLRRQRSADHLRYNIYGGQRVDRKAVVSEAEAFSAFFDYVYLAIRSTPPAGISRARAAAFRRFPESLLQSLYDRPEAVRWLGETRWNGKPHQVLAFADVDGTQLTLFFDEETHELRKTETLGVDGVFGDIASETVYDDYRTVRDVKLPYHYIDRRAGVVLDDQRASSIVLDAEASDTLFTKPAGLEVADFGPQFPNFQQLGDGVYAVLGGYNTIFVAFNEYVLVLEAGGSVREAEVVIAKIKETAPGKPIRYVVSTHWNFDHLAGIRPYIAEGATIIAPKSAHAIIQRAAIAARPLHPDALTRKPRTPQLETLGARERSFTDGVRSVIVHDITPSPHVNEMYIAYLPKEKTLFEADLLDISVPGKTGTAGDDTADLAEQITRLGLEVDRIFPVHGQIGTMEDLRQSLARRAQVRRSSSKN